MTTPAPTWLPPLEAGIPAELRALPQWVAWIAEWREKDQKWTKVPYNARTGEKAQTNNPATWATYEEAMAAFKADRADGVGFCFSEHGPYTGVDLDKCRDAATGAVDQWAADLLQEIGTYSEASVSGTGVHAILRARLPPGRRRKGPIEMYCDGRFFTVTGHVVGTIETVREVDIVPIHRKIFGAAEPEQTERVTLAIAAEPDDERLLDLARRARNGHKFTALWAGDWSAYSSQSEADLALCSILAFWTNRDEARIDRLFRRSGLMRDKWDRRATGGRPYGVNTVNEAIAGTTSTFTPHHATEYPDVDISALIGRSPAKDTGLPRDLLHVPGMVGELAAWINKTSHKQQPVLALGAAIAAVATVIGRKVRLRSGMRSNVYILGVARSGTGKERAREAIRQVFELAECSKLAAYDSVASDAAINSALGVSPSCLFLLDEAGREFAQMMQANAPTHVASIVHTLLRLYGASNGTYYGKAYADAERNIAVDQPHLSIYGTTVPRNLYTALTPEQVNDGFLSRFMIFESADENPSFRDVDWEDPPSGLVEQFRDWAAMKVPGRGNMSEQHPEPHVVEADDSARTLLKDLESDMEKLQGDMLTAGEDPGIFTRVGAASKKLALIRACGVTHESPRIDGNDAEWAAKLALELSHALARKVKRFASESRYEADLKRLTEIVRGANGITKTELSKASRWLRPRDREEAITHLVDAGIIAAKTESTGGRPVVRFFHTTGWEKSHDASREAS